MVRNLPQRNKKRKGDAFRAQALRFYLRVIKTLQPLDPPDVNLVFINDIPDFQKFIGVLRGFSFQQLLHPSPDRIFNRLFDRPEIQPNRLLQLGAVVSGYRMCASDGFTGERAFPGK